MGKRSEFLRRARDTYDTPWEAVEPLLPFLSPGTPFIEPCAGANVLLSHLEKAGHIPLAAYDIEPRDDTVFRKDVLALREEDLHTAACIITNPPWNRELLHRMLLHLRDLDIPAWLLLDANWMFTQQAEPFLVYCSHIVTVGRVRWIPGTSMTGKDDCAWFLFWAQPVPMTVFYGHPRGGHGFGWVCPPLAVTGVKRVRRDRDGRTH